MELRIEDAEPFDCVRLQRTKRFEYAYQKLRIWLPSSGRSAARSCKLMHYLIDAAGTPVHNAVQVVCYGKIKDDQCNFGKGQIFRVDRRSGGESSAGPHHDKAEQRHSCK